VQVLVSVVVLFVGVGFAIPCRAAEAPDVRRVLILYPFDNRLPATNLAGEAATTLLLASTDPRIDVYSDFLDLSRFEEPAYRETLAAFLTEKYAGKDIDLVLALGPPSLGFIGDYGESIAPGAKIVFGQVSNPAIVPPESAVGIVSSYSLARIMELATALQPDARNLVVVSGSSDFDRQWEETARRDLAPLGDRYEITYLGGLAFDDVLEQVSQLSSDTIILILSFFQDAAGQQFIPVEAAARIAEAASAPNYGPYSTYIGAGVVGGYTDTFESTGVAMGELALNVLTGTDQPGNRPTPEQAFRVDARALDRWRLSEDNLPPGAIVLFDEKSVWEEYGLIIVAMLTVLAIQSLLLAAMLVQRARRRRAEASLKDSEERMAEAAAAANVGLWDLDLRHGTVWTSDYCRELFGLGSGVKVAPEAMLGAVHPEDRAAMGKQVADLRAGRPLAGEFRLSLPDGGVRWVQAVSNLREDQSTGERRISGIFKDISARRLAELEVEKQRSEVAHISRVLMLGELSWAIAHELNQPLTAILANAESVQAVLMQAEPDIEEALSAIEEIIEDDNRAGQVIQRLRGLLRKDQARRELVDLNEILRSTLLLVQSELISRKISTILRLEPDLPPVFGDAVQLQQVAMNLLVNAMDAIAQHELPRREIVVSTRPAEPGLLELTVVDSGPGIAPDDREQLFQPFFTTKPSGLGLGLSICFSILRSHGGSLSLASAAAGGAIATITLPAAPVLVPAQ
jgi:PAS domain S-box-containing protein